MSYILQLMGQALYSSTSIIISNDDSSTSPATGVCVPRDRQNWCIARCRKSRGRWEAWTVPESGDMPRRVEQQRCRGQSVGPLLWSVPAWTYAPFRGNCKMLLHTLLCGARASPWSTAATLDDWSVRRLLNACRIWLDQDEEHNRIAR